jgi:hypothetical protein
MGKGQVEPQHSKAPPVIGSGVGMMVGFSEAGLLAASEDQGEQDALPVYLCQKWLGIAGW